MRVAFDTRPASDPDGIGRYARCLLAALKETAAPEDELVEVRRPAKALRAKSADLLHAPWMGGAMLHSPCPLIVTLHDLAALKRPSEHLRTGLRERLRHLAVQRALRVIVPSAAVAADAAEHLGIERERIVVIPHAADPAMRPRPAEEVAAVRARYQLPPDYLMWVGSMQHPDPGKRLAELAAAPRELPLVLVGPTRPWAHELPRVILTGQVPDEDLAAIYSGAHALVLSCENEGFGLPAVEALACGTPVAACRAPALVEVLADRAEFVEVGDMEALLQAAERAQRPAPEPPRWQWEDAGQATWNVYARAVQAAEEQRVSSRASRRLRAGGPPTPTPGATPAAIKPARGLEGP